MGGCAHLASRYRKIGEICDVIAIIVCSQFKVLHGILAVFYQSNNHVNDFIICCWCTLISFYNLVVNCLFITSCLVSAERDYIRGQIFVTNISIFKGATLTVVLMTSLLKYIVGHFLVFQISS